MSLLVLAITTLLSFTVVGASETEPMTFTTISDDGKSFTINAYNIDTRSIVVLATYNQHQLSEIYCVPYTGWDTLTFTTTESYTCAKVFIWENDWSKPLAQYEYLEPPQTYYSNLAVVTKVTNVLNTEYEEIYNIEFLQNGNLNALDTTYELAQDIVDINVGDIFEYSVNTNGIMDAIALDSNVGPAWNGSLDVVSSYGSSYDSNNQEKQYVFGVVYSKNQVVFGSVYHNLTQRTITIGSNRDRHTIPNDANFYLVDRTSPSTNSNVTVSSFSELKEYKYDPVTGVALTDNNYAVFMKYLDGKINDVVIFKGYVNTAATTYSPALAVATKIFEVINDKYEKIYNITFVQNGEVQTLATTHELYQNITSIKAGDIFEYSVNGEGVMDAIALGNSVGPAWNGSLESISTYGSAYDSNNQEKQYVFGVVYDKSSNRVITIGAENGDTHAIAANANFYLIDLNKIKNAISLSSYTEIRAYKETPAGDLIEDNDYAVFMKYYNGEINDVIIYKGFLLNAH